MEFSWTPEHGDLRAAVRSVLTAKAPLSRARELAEAGERHDPEMWETLAAQLGLQGLALPEDVGGSGGSLVDLAIVMEEMGAVLFGGPFLPTAVLAANVLAALPDDPVTAELLPPLAEGELTAAVAVVESDGRWAPESLRTFARDGGGGPVLDGDKELVLDGAGADVILVLARSDAGWNWYAVDGRADGLTRVPREVLDGTRPAARLELRGTPARLLGEPGRGWAVAERMRRTAAILLAAEQAGAAGELVRRTAEYATTRRQFGRPVGAFQGVKHRLADMAVRHEMARSAAFWAAWQEPGSPDREFGALVARSYCSDALLQTAKDTIQLHGGIGFTWEHDAHLFLRRARLDATLLGGTAEARAALLPHVLPDPPPELEGATP
ncbi:acyl-CoA dehydrogenase family protein [Actinomadura sp. BRA 177]|uniref:acyl-CoA dehydrogenase family protein n=1 Tax=Actinomadura sp. BRA 177 TaxID=2745202 RepID=UPI001596328F|nr:acyl-CoA dehydrogenase family protein [Actinomadura sp. BRA 177]NVI89062.1 acyl-CoA/acyl-ACP dehydrogenase [Actinomadura sp. BRA 177]